MSTLIKERLNLKRDKASAELLFNALKVLPTDLPLTYLASVPLTEEAWQIAHATGLSRTLICRDVGCENNPNFKRPAKTEEKTSSIGILAEYVIGRLITQATKKPITLVATGAIKEADFTIKDLRFDIKASAESAKFLYINEDAHKNEFKRPDFYIVFRIARDDTADIYAISASEVDKAKLLRVYSSCYQIPWPKLIPFYDEELAA